MATTTKQTTLAAVNTIISNIGQSPVTTLESGNPLVEIAEGILHEISRAVQSEGWLFNTEYHYTFTPDADGYIQMPTNALQIDPKRMNRDFPQCVVRDGKLYDLANHTNVFTEDIELDVVWLFDYEDLPEPFKNYTTIRAANVFAGRSVGSAEAVRFGEREELLARSTALEYDTQQGDYTIFADRDHNMTYNSYRPLDTLQRY